MNRHRPGYGSVVFALLLLGLAAQARGNGTPAEAAQPSPEPAEAAAPHTGTAGRAPDKEVPPHTSLLGKTGIDISSEDGRYRMHLWFRGQFRIWHPLDDAPTTAAAFDQPTRTSIDIRRARIKLGGHAYQEWLKYYFEYDFRSSTLLDLRMTLARLPWLQLRVGQWKVNFNRERADSSGKQQFVERSIVNREFTVDRQPGLMVAGHLWADRPADSWYLLGLFSGNGANQGNDDDSLMWFARYHWNFLGRDLPYAQSDVEYHDKPTGSLAFAAVGNRSPYTRFSSGGGGQLDGFEPGEAGRYDLLQWVQELAVKYRGLSIQQEYHWKRIEDNVDLGTRELRGLYAQAGFFPWSLSKALPRPLELAARYAWVDPDSARPEDDRHEWTLGANWFFSGHDNKLTVDASRLTLDEPGGPGRKDYRIRAQWDISF